MRWAMWSQQISLAYGRDTGGKRSVRLLECWQVMAEDRGMFERVPGEGRLACKNCRDLLVRNAASQRRARAAEAKVRILEMQLDEARREVRELKAGRTAGAASAANSMNSSVPPAMDGPAARGGAAAGTG